MAVRTVSIEKVTTHGDAAHVLKYTGLTKATDDSGTPVECPGSNDRSVQVLGTFGTGGSVRIEGSNVLSPSSDDDWAVLTDPQGNALNITTAKIETITELTRWIRPRVTAGDNDTNLSVRILIRRPFR